MTDTPTPEITAQDNASWRRCARIVMAVLVGGFALAWLLARWWLAPPRLMWTPTLILVGLSAWLPVLIVCFARNARGNVRKAILMLVGGALAAMVMLVLLGPTLGIFFTVTNADDPEPLSCDTGVRVGDRTQYTCQRNSMFGNAVLIVEGPAGSPFVRLVRVESPS